MFDCVVVVYRSTVKRETLIDEEMILRLRVHAPLVARWSILVSDERLTVRLSCELCFDGIVLVVV